MNPQVSISTALCLPVPDIAALIQGRIIAALPRMFLRPGQQFALYPSNILNIPLSVKQYYQSNFVPIAQANLNQNTLEKISIQGWAKCEQCQIIDDTKSLAALSQLTIWTATALEKILQQQQHIFLAYLRVYKLPQPHEVTGNPQINHKVGKFVSLPLTMINYTPVVSDRIFAQRQQQLQNLESPLHPELEELQSQLATLTHPAAKQLNDDIKVFLGWGSKNTIQSLDSKFAWINDIAALGNRSKEKDEGKTNYQAGTDFENIVRQSLDFLGWNVDYFHKGGAGGVDAFCSSPYPLVIECKAGKKIPNTTAVQLLNLGTLRLKSQELFQQSAKLIIGPGKPTNQLQEAAIMHKIAIIKPESLEELVKLQNTYPGSINLFELKEYLQPGSSDESVEKYVKKVTENIKLRSHIINTVKNYIQNANKKSAGVQALHGAYVTSNPPQPLNINEMYEMLIELSSPLTGYLGRDKGDNMNSDGFYFLRDL